MKLEVAYEAFTEDASSIYSPTSYCGRISSFLALSDIEEASSTLF